MKLAISVDPDIAGQVARAAGEENVSVSAWMTAAARRSLRIHDGLRAVAEWEAEHGAFDDQDLSAARARLRGPMPRPAVRRSPRR